VRKFFFKQNTAENTKIDATTVPSDTDIYITF